jgi:putative PIN family toxin of toxin-antitoxin system
MSGTTPKVVYDCNVFLQALSNPLGPAGQCLDEAINRRVALYVDTALLEELADVAARPEIRTKLRILPFRVAELMKDLSEIAIFIDEAPDVFVYDRDPDDAHYVNLALAADASVIVSRDKDLLDLMAEDASEAGTFKARFPSLRILDPVAFLRELRTASSE